VNENIRLTADRSAAQTKTLLVLLRRVGVAVDISVRGPSQRGPLFTSATWPPRDESRFVTPYGSSMLIKTRDMLNTSCHRLVSIGGLLKGLIHG
jgi:hypothetical protein